jgi:hypothetical protein
LISQIATSKEGRCGTPQREPSCRNLYSFVFIRGEMPNQMSERSEKQPAFVAVYRPADQSKLAMAEMILDREGVNYYVENEFASLGELPGFQVRVMVQGDRADECKRLLQEELGL